MNRKSLITQIVKRPKQHDGDKPNSLSEAIDTDLQLYGEVLFDIILKDNSDIISFKDWFTKHEEINAALCDYFDSNCSKCIIGNVNGYSNINWDSLAHYSYSMELYEKAGKAPDNDVAIHYKKEIIWHLSCLMHDIANRCRSHGEY